MKIFDAVNFGTKYLKGSIAEPRIESEALLSFTLGASKEYLLINRDKELTDDSFNKYMEVLDLRKSGMPYQYIVGEKHFMGLIFNVSPSVLIPRNDTEILV
ncbi:peptide chain release factor N(5)-glutamine methyltransferase, partial [Thermoanaerobacterium thermosaccharolyticum]